MKHIARIEGGIDNWRFLKIAFQCRIITQVKSCKGLFRGKRSNTFRQRDSPSSNCIADCKFQKTSSSQ